MNFTKIPRAFTLTEVVLALGVASFCIVGLFAIYAIGIQTMKDSADNIQTANMASFIIAQRRSAPTVSGTVTPFVLPILTVSASNTEDNPIYLTSSGEITDRLNDAYCRLIYDIQADVSSVTQIHFTISTPAGVTLSNARIRYDVLTYVYIP